MIKYIILLFSFFYFTGGVFSQEVNGNFLKNDTDLSVIQVWGTHYERGYAVGYLIPDKIVDLYQNYIVPEFGSYLSIAKQLVSSPEHFSIPQEYIDEAQGMLDGAVAAGADMTGVDYKDILVANAYLDISAVSAKAQNLGNGCSTLMSWGDATDHTDINTRSVISRHVDWSPDDVVVRNHVIVAHIPSEVDEQPWVMIGFAGQISALSGFNDNGLCSFQHMLSDFSGSGSLNMAYEPVWFSIRKGLEQYDYNQDESVDVQDLKTVIAENQNGYADGFIITMMGKSTAQHDSLIACVAELAPSGQKITFRGNEYPDSIPGDNLYAANYEIKRNDHVHLCTRYNNVINLIGSGKDISSHKNWQIMEEGSNGGWSNIQFMQVLPEDRIFNFSYFHNDQAAFEVDSITYTFDELFDIPTSSDQKKKIEPKVNLSNSKIYVQGFNEPGKLKLTDSYGRLLFSYNGSFQNEISIPEFGISSAIIFYELEDENGEYYSGKLLYMK
jgi:hypothetical protein